MSPGVLRAAIAGSWAGSTDSTMKDPPDDTRVTLRLSEIGTEFVARSEGKRLMRNLDRFQEIFLDFSGVEFVGQGFVDEVFRVWAASNPEVSLIPESMSPPVELMVRRGLGPRLR